MGSSITRRATSLSVPNLQTNLSPISGLGIEFLPHSGADWAGEAVPSLPAQTPTSYQACAPCQVWTWDITWMPGPVSGMFFYLYLIVDIFSRKIVGWEVHERESADLAAALIRQAVLAEGCIARPLVLHADNGSPMKGATMKVTMEKLGITASYSRPRVSKQSVL